MTALFEQEMDKKTIANIPIIRSKRFKHVLCLCVFLTFLIYELKMYTFDNKENIISKSVDKKKLQNFIPKFVPSDTKMLLNSTPKFVRNDEEMFLQSSPTFVPNHLNKAYKIGILILCNYNENKEAMPSILSKLSDQCIPSIYRTMERDYKYKIYIGVNEGLQKHVASKYVDFSVIALDNEAFSDGINSLAMKALGDQIEYFVMLSYNTVLTLNFWISQAIYSLKGHCPSDVGTVFHYCCERNANTIVHRTHLIMSGSLFPAKLNIKESITWLHGFYYSNYFSVIPFNIEINSFNLIKIKTLDLEQTDTNVTNILKIDKSPCVISYSLYGSNPRYTVGALENIYLSKIIYKGWHVWIYHDKSVPESLLDIICNQQRIRCIDMSSSIIKNRRSWRFLVASERNVSHYIIRDIDSRLSFREKVAVNEWMLSGKSLHTMRDHPGQSYFINAGMWGGTRDTYPKMELALQTHNFDQAFSRDSEFLNTIVWPIANASVMQHDSVQCVQFGGVPFPTTRIGYEHVGSVYINGVVRNSDVDSLKKFRIPDKCNTQ